MKIGLRILALIIDCVLCFFSIPVVFYATGWIINVSGELSIFLLPLWFALLVAWPFLYFGATTGLWGKTPGKFVCRLYVTDVNGNRPGFWRGLGREVLKLLSIGSVFGVLFCIFQILYQGTVWYDHLCGTEVCFKPYVRLTETQKRYRQYMKERHRSG
ncbi:MAG: RDD family protein [Planctomycetota bacterium]|jgi:uncharacterized RDD family membrane protein YckC